MKKSVLAAGSFALAAALVAAPTVAFAEPWGGGQVVIGDNTNGASWDINDEGSIDHSYVYVDGQTFDRVICGTTGGLRLNDSDFNDTVTSLDITTDSYGDKVITGAGTFDGVNLDVTVEYRVFAAGDVLRTSYLLTNDTQEAITVTPSVHEDPSDNSSDSAFSTDGNNTADTADSWYSTFDASYVVGDGEPSAVYTKFWGKKPVNLNGFAFADSQSSEDVEFAPLTIEPGQSYNWIFFHSYRAYALSENADVDAKLAADNAAAIAAGRAAVAEFGSNGNSLPASGRLVRGLDLSIASNWAPAQAVPSLANTGSEDMLLGFAGLGLIALGSAAMVINRRKENA